MSVFYELKNEIDLLSSGMQRNQQIGMKQMSDIRKKFERSMKISCPRNGKGSERYHPICFLKVTFEQFIGQNHEYGI